MNLIRTIIVFVAIMFLFGCATDKIQSPLVNQEKTQVDFTQTSSVSSQSISSAKSPYETPILLGRSKNKIVDMLGEPDQTIKSTDTLMGFRILRWTWNNKSANGWNTTVGYEAVAAIKTNMK